MKVQIKKLHPDAIVPFYSRPDDAGMDITTTGLINENSLYVEYGTGLAISVPPGYVGLIFPRSSISNYNLSLSNAVGVVDPGYTGEIKFRFRKTWDSDFAKVYETGNKIGQLIIIPIPRVQFEEVTELDETVRGENGYGSSGK